MLQVGRGPPLSMCASGSVAMNPARASSKSVRSANGRLCLTASCAAAVGGSASRGCFAVTLAEQRRTANVAAVQFADKVADKADIALPPVVSLTSRLIERILICSRSKDNIQDAVASRSDR